MKIIIALALSSVLSFPALSQVVEDKDHQSMIEAEYAFSNSAKQTNTRDAFIAFLADSAITFGEHPRKGKKHLEKQAADPSWLFWKPIYSDIASSGDFGFNTGPWELRKDRTGEPVAYGQFISVWKKERGQWKAAIDIGVSHAKPSAQNDSLKTASLKLKNLQVVSKTPMQRIIAEEQKFIRDFSAKKGAAYASVLSAEARVFRHQHFPFLGKEILTAKAYHPIAYKFVDGELAPSGDMAYVYGKALVEVIDNGKKKKVDGNYMRIWKKEDGKTWKIVIDVVTYL
jgi:ketosteroid isomerase-like protein